jgi:tmRNA-binding protein
MVKERGQKVIASNRKARHDWAIPYDKRQDIAKRDANREIAKAHGRALKGRY